MPSELDEALYWAAKAADAHHNALDTVRASAARWQAAIAAFLGAYATVGFVVGPTTLASLPASGWKYLILAALTAAGVIAFVAVVLANKAANGMPEVETQHPLTGPELASSSIGDAERSRQQLRYAIWSAAAAGLLALLGSFGILATGLLSTPPSPSVLLSGPSGSYCGTLQTTNGVASVLLGDGRLVPLRGGSVTVVSSCGGS